MTVHDTTYFKSEPRQWDHMAEPYKWHNTCHFLRLTQNKRYKTYSDAEIQHHLENKLPTAGASQNRGATAPLEDDSQRSQENLVTAVIVG